MGLVSLLEKLSLPLIVIILKTGVSSKSKIMFHPATISTSSPSTGSVSPGQLLASLQYKNSSEISTVATSTPQPPIH